MIYNRMRDLPIGRMGIFVAMVVVCAYATQLTVTSRIDSSQNSLRSAVAAASAGDTIVFSTDENDTIVLKDAITIVKNITILGKNLKTGRRSVIRVDTPAVSVYRVFTITLGNVSLRDMSIRGGKADSGGAVFVNGQNTRILLDSVEVRDGLSPKIPYFRAFGAGIFNGNSDLVLRGCLISNNTCNVQYRGSSYGFYMFGGGISNKNGRVSAYNTTITNNLMISYNVESSNSPSASIYAYGAGLYNDSGIVIIDHCTVSANDCFGRGGGAGLCNNCGSMNVSNSYIANNMADRSHDDPPIAGGGIYNIYGFMLVEKSTINGNVCRAHGACGGGVCNDWGLLTIVNSTIVNNFAKGTYSNASGEGGGLYNHFGPLTMIYCTVCNNGSVSPYSSNSFGGGIYADRQGCMMNSIVVHDSACPTLNSNFYSESDYYFPDTMKAINSQVGSGYAGSYSLSMCDTQITAQQVFGTPTPALDTTDNAPRTIPIVEGSPAVGAGIKAGIYYQDTVIASVTNAYAKGAYQKGGTWFDAITDAVVPPGISVDMIAQDQRGLSRKTPSCIGAFELGGTTSLNSTKNRTIASFLSSPRCKGLYIRSEFPITALVKLYDPLGRLVVSKFVSVKQQDAFVGFPELSRGVFLCKIASMGNIKTFKLIR